MPQNDGGSVQTFFGQFGGPGSLGFNQKPGHSPRELFADLRRLGGPALSGQLADAFGKKMMASANGIHPTLTTRTHPFLAALFALDIRSSQWRQIPRFRTESNPMQQPRVVPRPSISCIEIPFGVIGLPQGHKVCANPGHLSRATPGSTYVAQLRLYLSFTPRTHQARTGI